MHIGTYRARTPAQFSVYDTKKAIASSGRALPLAKVHGTTSTARTSAPEPWQAHLPQLASSAVALPPPLTWLVGGRK